MRGVLLVPTGKTQPQDKRSPRRTQQTGLAQFPQFTPLTSHSVADHTATWLCVQLLSHVQLFAPLPMEFSKQEYWSGLPFLTPGDLSNPGIEPMSLASPALADGFFTISTTREAYVTLDSSSIQAQISQVCFFHFLMRLPCQVELILNKCDAFLLLIWIWKFKAGKDSSCLCLASPYRRKEKSPIWFWTGMHGFKMLPGQEAIHSISSMCWHFQSKFTRRYLLIKLVIYFELWGFLKWHYWLKITSGRTKWWKMKMFSVKRSV